MGKRKMTAALELLMVIVILISGFSAADDDVVAETDEMARRIEEESKKVDEKTNDMVSAIEAKGKIIEDANQDNRFKEASKHVDDIMDKSEEAVDDKADFAEELENEADRKVEELSRKVEEVSNRDNNKGITRKRSTPVIMGLGTKTSSGPGLERRSTVTYQVDVPSEQSVGEEIEEVMKEGEKMSVFSEGLNKNHKKKKERTGILSESKKLKNKDNSRSEETDATKQEESEDNFSDSQTYSDQNLRINGNEDNFSDEQEDGNETTGEDISLENFIKSKPKESNEDANTNESMDDNYAGNVFHENDSYKNYTSNEDAAMAKDNNQTLTEEKENDDDEHDGQIFNVDVYKEKTSLPLMDTISRKNKNISGLVQKENSNDTIMNGSSTTAVHTRIHTLTQSRENGSQTEQHHAHEKQSKVSVDVGENYKTPMNINFRPDVQVLNPDQKFLNEMEDGYALRKKQRLDKTRDKELQQLGATQLDKKSDALWKKMSAANDPEMVLRWPSLGKVLGKTTTNQKISIISPGEVDFLQTEYPDYMRRGSNGHESGLVRDSVGYKRRNVLKALKRKKNPLKKLLKLG